MVGELPNDFLRVDGGSSGGVVGAPPRNAQEAQVQADAQAAQALQMQWSAGAVPAAAAVPRLSLTIDQVCKSISNCKN